MGDEHLVLWCAAIYAAVFFCPGDLFYQLVNLKPVYVPIAVLKEIYRGKKIFAGLQEGATAFPASPYLIPVIVAVLKGNGSAFAAPFARAVRGDLNAAKSELMSPSVTTKGRHLLWRPYRGGYPNYDAVREVAWILHPPMTM